MKYEESHGRENRRPIIVRVLQQHADDAASLFGIRMHLSRCGRIRLVGIADFDDRIAAHLDGLAVSSERASCLCDVALENPSAGVLFVAAVSAIVERRLDRLEHLGSIAEAVRELEPGLLGAFDWVDASRLQGIIVRYLNNAAAFPRYVGISACVSHQVDPRLLETCRDSIPSVRARALRAVGELGRLDASTLCAAAADDDDPACRIAAAWSGVLLGNRGSALESLATAALESATDNSQALRLSLLAMPTSAAHRLLQQIAAKPNHTRTLIEGSGLAGHPAYVPWLITRMKEPSQARLAAEAVAIITGADLSEFALEGAMPEHFESGPNDDPDDPNVDMDPDDGLPWPDPDKITDWWSKNSHRFQPGTRYFMGQPVTREHCIEVLKNGYQRQRILAAHYLCLLDPGTPLFNTSAPAWRQQRLLAEMR